MYEQMDTCYIQRWYKFKASLTVGFLGLLIFGGFFLLLFFIKEIELCIIKYWYGNKGSIINTKSLFRSIK